MYPQQPGAGAPQMPQQPQAAGAPPQAGGMAESGSGLRKLPPEALGFNQDMQNILISRIEMVGSKNPQAFDRLDAALTREAAMELLQILPELKPIFDALGIGTDGGGSAGMAQASMPMRSAPAPQQASDGDTNPLMDDEDDEDEDEDMPVSRGLVG